MKVAFVVWRDAKIQVGNVRVDEIDSRCVQKTAGLLVDDEGDCITMAVDADADSPELRDVIHIPKVLISDFRTIDVDKMTKRKVVE